MSKNRTTEITITNTIINLLKSCNKKKTYIYILDFT